jgi:trans-AT polyketide synthase/acyltransferase/oxidoreductase domain-containing protein
MGADFIVTGSINQCTVEAGTSDAVKDILQELNVQDTAYAPAGDMFEIGAKIQVVKRGLFFPVRANKLYELYQRYNALDEIDAKTKQQIQEKYLKRSFEEVWKETRAHYLSANPTKVAEIDGNPKQKMALIFKWYFVHSTRLALSGDAQQRVDYQIQCGPALGAFNQTVRSTALQSWRQRRVAEIGLHIMESAAELLDRWYAGLSVKRHIGLPFLANRNSELGVSGHSVGHHEVSAASGRLEYEASC